MNEHTSKFVVLGGTILVFIVFFAIGRSSAPSASPTTTVNTADTTTTSSTPNTTVPPNVAEPAFENSNVPGWTRLHSGDLGARTGFSVAVAGDRVVVWGGGGSGGSSHSSSGWSRMAATPIYESENPVTLWDGSELFVFTGEAAAWDPSSDTWRTLDSQPPGLTRERAGPPLTGVITENGIVVVGSEPQTEEGPTNAYAIAYDHDFQPRLVDPPPFPLTHAESFWTGTEVLVLGSDTAQAHRVSFATVDPESGTWEVLDAPPLPDPFPFSAEWTGDSLIAWDRSTRAFEWTQRDGWTELPPVPVDQGTCNPLAEAYGSDVFVSLCGQVAVWDDTADRWVRVFAPTVEDGYPNSGCDSASRTVVDDPADPSAWRILLWCSSVNGTAFWSFDPSAYEPSGFSFTRGSIDRPPDWELFPNPRAAGLSGTTLVWSGTELLSFGGHGTNEESATGWGYDPLFGVHHRIPAAPYPGRYGQSAVMADGEMYIFRGPMTAWNPNTLAWRSTPLSPWPLAFGPRMVWTGDRIIVFGSNDSPTVRSAIYDPATDSWIEMATQSGAEIRDPVVAWSGSHLYTFGGFDFLVEPLRDSVNGARYDPATDTWEDLPPVPESDIGLYLVAGDWVGDELVVVGVDADSWWTNDPPPLAGYAYSPDTGTWRTITSPASHEFEVFSWARPLSVVEHFGELAVFLPAGPGEDSAAIGLYNPSSDSWRYLPSHATPENGPGLVSGEMRNGDRFIAFLSPDGTVIVHDRQTR